MELTWHTAKKCYLNPELANQIQIGHLLGSRSVVVNETVIIPALKELTAMNLQGF